MFDVSLDVAHTKLLQVSTVKWYEMSSVYVLHFWSIPSLNFASGFLPLLITIFVIADRKASELKADLTSSLQVVGKKLFFLPKTCSNRLSYAAMHSSTSMPSLPSMIAIKLRVST